LELGKVAYVVIIEVAEYKAIDRGYACLREVNRWPEPGLLIMSAIEKRYRAIRSLRVRAETVPNIKIS